MHSSSRVAASHASAASSVRPKLDTMWRRFQDVVPLNDESYPDGVIKSLQTVGDKIGGGVKKNFDMGIEDIRNSTASYPVSPSGFTNACATRLSYLLNYSGFPIGINGLWQTVSGADHKNYIFRVRDMKTFLPHTFGKPDIDKRPRSQPEDFAGKKGIIVFDVHFSDASGHATLWDGTKAVDEDYSNPRPGAALQGVRLWVCP